MTKSDWVWDVSRRVCGGRLSPYLFFFKKHSKKPISWTRLASLPVNAPADRSYHTFLTFVISYWQVRPWIIPASQTLWLHRWDSKWTISRKYFIQWEIGPYSTLMNNSRWRHGLQEKEAAHSMSWVKPGPLCNATTGRCFADLRSPKTSYHVSNFLPHLDLDTTGRHRIFNQWPQWVEHFATYQWNKQPTHLNVFSVFDKPEQL